LVLDSEISKESFDKAVEKGWRIFPGEKQDIMNLPLIEWGSKGAMFIFSLRPAQVFSG
jgi:hypothetical protein